MVCKNKYVNLVKQQSNSWTWGCVLSYIGQHMSSDLKKAREEVYMSLGKGEVLKTAESK